MILWRIVASMLARGEQPTIRSLAAAYSEATGRIYQVAPAAVKLRALAGLNYLHYTPRKARTIQLLKWPPDVKPPDPPKVIDPKVCDWWPGLSRMQRDLIEAYCDLYKEKGYPPNSSEIAAALGRSRSSVHQGLGRLRDKGIVAFDRSHRSLRLL